MVGVSEPFTEQLEGMPGWILAKIHINGQEFLSTMQTSHNSPKCSPMLLLGKGDHPGMAQMGGRSQSRKRESMEITTPFHPWKCPLSLSHCLHRFLHSSVSTE
uniref:Uncharacterized protein n=1 Tax=Sphaerodactylus townsendi TaxID=933632 RepID=A0ACB8FHK9_9SAUR